jgi:hypothetical protein
MEQDATNLKLRVQKQPNGSDAIGEYTWYQERTVIFGGDKKRQDEDKAYEKEEITKEM